MALLFDHPLLTHIFLLGGDVVATIVVGWGILWEAPSQSEKRHQVAMWLVICGIAVETVCSISLFAFDEAVSQEQQGKIIALEQRLLTERSARISMLDQLKPRDITKDQFQNLKAAIKGNSRKIYVFWKCDPEAFAFGMDVQGALQQVGFAAETVFANPISSGKPICFDRFPDLPGIPEEGIAFLAYPSAGERESMLDLAGAMTKAHIAVAGISTPPGPPKQPFHPAIFIGLKPPPFQQLPAIFSH